eukprot:Gb_26695 [translate_table: standard]
MGSPCYHALETTKQRLSKSNCRQEGHFEFGDQLYKPFQSDQWVVGLPKNIYTCISFSTSTFFNAIDNVPTQIKRGGIRPDSDCYAKLLKGCVNTKALAQGKQVHAHITKTGFLTDVLLGNYLVNMYAKCKHIEAARQMFDEMPRRDLITWTAIVTGYAQNGHGKEALEFFGDMRREGLEPNQFTFPSVLKACAGLLAVEQGKQVHYHIIKTGFETDIFVANALVDMYAKCGSIEDARQVFNRMPERNVVSWNAMFAGYAQNEHSEDAVLLFNQMQAGGIAPDQFTLSSILSACANLEDLEKGMLVHARMIKIGLESDVFARNALVDMYAKCGIIEYARQVFDKMAKWDMVSWNAIIAGSVQYGHDKEALLLFGRMEPAGVKPNHFTLSSVLKACASITALEQGKQVHSYIVKTGFELDVYIGGGLVDMYAKCECIDNARNMFDKMHIQDLVSWNAMIAGYAQAGHAAEAMKIFDQILQLGMKPNQSTLSSVLKSCSGLATPEECRQVHSYIIKTGTESDIFMGNALVDAYCKCGGIETARKVFDQMSERDVVSCTSLIAGYAQSGQGEEALDLSWKMQCEGIKPDQFAFSSALNACASLSALEQGKQFHVHVFKAGFESDVFAGNALVNMYAKCGSIEDAHQAFDNILERDVVSWTAIIAGCAHHGQGIAALKLFEQMLKVGMKPNHITFVSVMSACNHAGLVDEGRLHFESMSRDHGIEPGTEHYACMVDLLGRAGRVDEAEKLVNEMPFKANASVWGALLGACRIHGNMDLGRRAAEHLFELEPEKSGTHVLLANMYAAAGKWDDVANVRRMMKDSRVKKEPGCSWIEVKNMVHAFVVEDRSHPQTDEIYAMLERLSRQMEEAGYVPNTNFVLHNVEQHEKEHLLCYHSEKLALSFALINTPPGSPIRIKKNIRVCGDCHTAIKFISRIVEREIVLRDTNRFHHFNDGLCSCGDYW